MKVVKELVGFLRWRLIPVRYAGKIARSLPGRSPQPLPPRAPAVARLRKTGWVPAPSVPGEMLDRIRNKYFPRAEAVVARKGGHPFTSLFHGADISPEDPICQLAFSRELLDAVHDYFGGRFRYNSIQIAYSWPTEGRREQSQLWHRDYGDTRSFHWVVYLNDVLDDEGGPFTFVDRPATERIGNSAIIRRIDDERFRRELGDGEILRFLGKAGEGIFVDPSLCYHFGSRCRRPRLAMFVTFSTDTPFTDATELVMSDREKLIETACILRPDLSSDYIRAILTV